MSQASQKKGRGQPSAWSGSKLAFLESLEPEFVVAHEKSPDASSKFFDRVIQSFFSRYGFDVPIRTDCAPLAPNANDNIWDFDELPLEEVMRRQGVVKKF